VLSYSALLERVDRRRDQRLVDAVISETSLRRAMLDDPTALTAEIEKVQGVLERRHPEMLPLVVRMENEAEHSAKRLILKPKGAARETVLDHAFLTSPEFEQLLALHQQLAEAGPGPFRVTVDGETSEVVDLPAALEAVRTAAKHGQSIQRYKGLGEMNPEQLWDTTMNPESRTLLQVRIEDAVEADGVFTMLMGDAVEPRRAFIEKHALDVVNLDI